MYIAQPAALRHGSSAGSGTLPTGQSARHQPNPTHAHPPSTPTSPLQQPTPPAPPKPSTPSPLWSPTPPQPHQTPHPCSPPPQRHPQPHPQKKRPAHWHSGGILGSGAPSAPAIRTRPPRPHAVSIAPETHTAPTR